MKLIIFIILSAFCVNVYSKYLDNLDRSFDKIENKIVDIYIPLTDEEFKQLEKLTQVTLKQVQTSNPNNIEDFEALVNCTVRYDGKEEFRPLTKFKTGGMYARSNSKVGYNLKFEDKIFTRKSLRLRPDPNDKSYMREKLTADILNRAGLPSIQSSYARLYINNKFFGLYSLLDSVKPYMIKKLFKLDDKSEDMTLFQCKNNYMDFTIGSETHCIDANNETSTDLSKLADFVKKVNEATSIEQFDEFLDVDLFLKSVIVEWLIGSFDHFLILGHNFNLYKRPTDNKWCMILYDFDNTFGFNLGSGSFRLPPSAVPYDYQTLSFKDFNSKVNHKIFQYLIYKDDTRFKKNLRDILVYAFNPVILDEHIKDLREYLLPYVTEDLTPIDGVLPGRINKVGVVSRVTVNDFKTTNELMNYIQKRYNAVISEYKMDRFEIETLATTEKPTSYFSTATAQKKEKEDKENLCWSRSIGFVCCDKCNVLYVDDEGKWGIEDKYWCGINPSKCKYEGNECAKNKNGLKCCSTCEIHLTDATGRYGYENGEWCNTPFNC